jgi:hypothetical protein
MSQEPASLSSSSPSSSRRPDGAPKPLPVAVAFVILKLGHYVPKFTDAGILDLKGLRFVSDADFARLLPDRSARDDIISYCKHHGCPIRNDHEHDDGDIDDDGGSQQERDADVESEWDMHSPLEIESPPQRSRSGREDSARPILSITKSNINHITALEMQSTSTSKKAGQMRFDDSRISFIALSSPFSIVHTLCRTVR